jgi:hypothetical protein
MMFVGMCTDQEEWLYASLATYKEGESRDIDKEDGFYQTQNARANQQPAGLCVR